MSKRVDRMSVLVELAEVEQDKAAKTLAMVQGELTAHQNQLQALESYAQEYAQNINQKGMVSNSTQLQTTSAFMDKMRRAKVAQSLKVDEYVDIVETARQAWLQKHLRVKSLHNLLERLKKNDQLKLDRQEQKMLDELSMQASVYHKK